MIYPTPVKTARRWKRLREEGGGGEVGEEWKARRIQFSHFPPLLPLSAPLFFYGEKKKYARQRRCSVLPPLFSL
jgi:hypothetical protein